MDITRLRQIDECQWELPREGAMKVRGIIFASLSLLKDMDDKVIEQVSNVSTLPGIVKASMAMPDAHWGYGFPIGGVGAFDPDEGGIISVGGVGYDISCGVRCLLTALTTDDIMPRIETIMDGLFKNIPAGVGSKGTIRLSSGRLDDVLTGGAKWAVENGYGANDDLEFTEENGRIEGADPSFVSDIAKERQNRQIGTLGSGNHYLELQKVDKVYDKEAASAFNISQGDVIISIHCGSRALGHQIGTDYIQLLGRASRKYGIPIPERELVCAPINSPEGQAYYKAMACGVNCALANRQVITHLVREVFSEILPKARITTMYDISHNTCKIETHKIEGRERRLFVHRKGATRAFGPGRMELPLKYRQTGQPVFIGGTMGTCSYILAGTETGEALSLGSACHGAGRAMSRKKAIKRWKGKDIIKRLKGKGIIIRAVSLRGIAEEAPDAYKDVSEVVNATQKAGIAKKVARLLPIGVVKG